jgi:hypothetical protein
VLCVLGELCVNPLNAPGSATTEDEKHGLQMKTDENSHLFFIYSEQEVGQASRLSRGASSPSGHSNDQ